MLRIPKDIIFRLLFQLQLRVESHFVKTASKTFALIEVDFFFLLISVISTLRPNVDDSLLNGN